MTDSTSKNDWGQIGFIMAELQQRDEKTIDLRIAKSCGRLDFTLLLKGRGMTNDDTDQFFAMFEDLDFDFPDSNKHLDVPVLSYHWSRSPSIASCAIEQLADAGEQAMRDTGMQRIVRNGHHLRGDTDTGQRVKMTAIKGVRGSMYLLMTAGLPGTRDKAKEITARLAAQIRQLVNKPSDEA